MKKTLKIMSMMLALLLLLSSMAILSSCNGKGNEGDQTESGDGGGVEGSLPPLEVKQLDRDLRVLWPEVHADGHYLHNEIAVLPEEAQADILSSAIATRNFAIESAYNITIISDTAFISQIPKTVRNEAAGQDSSYDAIASTIKFMSPIAMEGWLKDYNEMAYYSDANQPWWNHDLMQDFAIANARYFGSGDIIYSDDFYPYCTYVNTVASNSYGITEDYYELVRNKEWTLEKFHMMAADVAVDDDGDPLVVGERDMVGAVINPNFYKAAYYAAGKGMIEVDDRGYPVWRMEKNRTQSILEKVVEITHDGSCFDAGRQEGDHVMEQMRLFSNNKTLFLVEELIYAERISRSENPADFKLLPFPLYETGSEYISVLNDALVLSVPLYADNTDEISLILSAMSRESIKTLTPAFFETVLTYKYMKDPNSVATLEIILDSTVAPDVATIQDWGGFMAKYKELAVAGSTNFSNTYDGNIGTAMIKLEEYCVMLDNFYRK